MLNGVGDERIHRRHCFYMAGRREWRDSAAGGVGLRLISRKALFFRREAQTFCREKAPASVRVCASFPGKPYSSVEGRKPFAGKSPRRRWGFAPHTRESLILPLRGANFLPGKAPASVRVCALHPGKPYSTVEGRKPVSREPARSWCTEPRKAMIFRFRCTKS